MENDGEIPEHEPVPEESVVTIFSSSNHDAEAEALVIKGILDTGGVPSAVVGPKVLPTLEFDVQVAEHHATEALRLIEEARAAGPAAAAEAEALTEGVVKPPPP
jgi:hypothetical protein